MIDKLYNWIVKLDYSFYFDDGGKYIDLIKNLPVPEFDFNSVFMFDGYLIDTEEKREAVRNILGGYEI